MDCECEIEYECDFQISTVVTFPEPSILSLVLSREGMWLDMPHLIPDISFRPFHAPVVSFTWFIKNYHLMTNISWLGRPQFSAQLLQILQKKFDTYPLIHAMDFKSVELCSVTYLRLYLARKCETQQSCKQTVKQLSQWETFTITRSWNSSSRDHFPLIRQWNQRCVKQPEIKGFQQKSGIIAIWSLDTRKKSRNSTPSCTCTRILSFLLTSEKQQWKYFGEALFEKGIPNSQTTLLVSKRVVIH